MQWQSQNRRITSNGFTSPKDLIKIDFSKSVSASIQDPYLILFTRRFTSVETHSIQEQPTSSSYTSSTCHLAKAKATRSTGKSSPSSVRSSVSLAILVSRCNQHRTAKQPSYLNRINRRQGLPVRRWRIPSFSSRLFRTYPSAARDGIESQVDSNSLEIFFLFNRKYVHCNLTINGKTPRYFQFTKRTRMLRANDF